MPHDRPPPDSNSDAVNNNAPSNSGDSLEDIFFDDTAHDQLRRPDWRVGDRPITQATQYRICDDDGEGGLLGEGLQGSVWAAKDEAGNAVAIKFVNLLHRERVKNVLEILSHLNPHPNVIQIIGKPYDLDNGLAVVMPRAKHSLHKYLMDGGTWKGHQQLDIRLLNLMEGAAAGVDFLNDNGLCHRDIKPANLLEFMGGTVVVGDPDLLFKMETPIARGSFAGTEGHIAGETEEGDEDGKHTYTTRTDQVGLAATYVTLRTGIINGIITDPVELAIVAKAGHTNPFKRHDSCTAFIDELRKLPSTIPGDIQAELDRATLLTDVDKYAEAIPILEKALVMAEDSRHLLARVKIRARLAHALYEACEDFKGAEQHFQDALAIVPVENLDLRHSILHGLGDMLLFTGRLDQAKATVHAALDIAKITGKQDAVGRSLISLGLMEHHLGHADAANSHLDEAIQNFHQLSLTLKGESLKENAHALAVCYQNKAQLARDDGRPEEALALYAKVEELHRESGDKLNSGKIHLLAGRLHCANAEFEQGFQCFKRAMAVFVDLKNHLWMARTAAAFARLYAQHAQEDNSPNTELWEEAAKAALAANDGFEEAKAVSEHIQGILFSADVFANLVKAGLRANVQKQIHEICKSVPKEHEANAAAEINRQMERVHSEIGEKVRTDTAIGRSLHEAHAFAEKHQLFEEEAECYVLECRLRMAKDDTEGRNNLLKKALGCLQKALAKENIPRRRARLMGQIGTLHRQLGQKSEWASWVKRVGEIFEETSDIYGLANYHLEMGGVHRSQGRLDDQIASERKALELIEGRSFYELAVAARINLAHGLSLRSEHGEALSLLTEAEAICEAHKMQGLISKIAHIRSSIEEDTQAGQAAQHSLRRLLVSLHQLVRFKPEDATSYLAFWYYAWKAELLAILRSGPGISLMVVSDDAERFMSFASRFANFADHFSMATTTEPTVVASARTLKIPPRWRYPATFTFVGMRKAADAADSGDDLPSEDETDTPPRIRLVGPARLIPPYMHVSVGGDGSRISVRDTPRLPAAALHLMLQRPINELIRRRAVWFPSPRFGSEDPFLTDLRVAHERGLFPVYFDRFPTSDGVTAIDAVKITVPDSVLMPAGKNLADKWKRMLLKITRLQKDEARSALFDLPEAFPADSGSEKILQMEVHLFEFIQIGQKVIRPVLLVR